MRFCAKLRKTLPKTYNESKLKRAIQLNQNLMASAFNIDSNEQQIDPTKAQLSEHFATQVQAMNGLYLDLTPEEINDFQNIIEDEESESENEFSGDLVYIEAETSDASTLLDETETQIFNDICNTAHTSDVCTMEPRKSIEKGIIVRSLKTSFFLKCYFLTIFVVFTFSFSPIR